MSWLSESFYNIINLTAIKDAWANMTNDFWYWVLCEMSPQFYLTGFTWAGLFEEMIGWTKHIGLGAGFMILWLIASKFIKKLNNFMGLAAMAGIAFLIEVIQTAIIRFKYIFFLNSIIDIAFYVVGSALLLYVWKKIKNRWFK